MPPEQMQIPPSNIHSVPELTPKRDERFLQLLQSAVGGKLPVFYGAVPLPLCVPFDLDYRPDLHPAGAGAIKQVIKDWEDNHLHHMFVYPRGRWLVVPDDYVTLFAALSGLPDYVPCWILGKPDNELIKDLQGPIAPDEIPRLLGWSS